MISLRPIEYVDAPVLDGSEYGAMSADERLEMITSSLAKSHDGLYFEFFIVTADDAVVGFMNVCAHSKHIISVGPEIKPEYKRRGYAYEAEKIVLEMMKQKGFTIATATVLSDNVGSNALQKKLGFEVDRTYINKHGHEAFAYIKAL